MDRVLAEMHSPFTALLFSLCGGLIRRTPQGSTPLAWSSDRHGIARVLTAQVPAMPFGHGSHHVRPFGAPSGLLIRHALRKYGELHARTHALCLLVVRRFEYRYE